MNYIPDQACLNAARAAAGDDLPLNDILAAFQRISAYKEKLQAEGRLTGLDERVRKFVEEEAERTRIAAALQRRHAALNVIVREKLNESIRAMIEGGLKPHQAVLAILEGSVHGVEGARKSVAAFRLAYEAEFRGGMMYEIQRERPHLVRMMGDKRLDKNVLREMRELRKDGKPGITGDEDAVFLAKTFAKYAEKLRIDLNKLGANIGKLDGWDGVQMHDPIKLIKSDARVWAAKVATLIDIERTFPEGLSEVEVLDALSSMYDTIITGMPARPTARERGQFIGPANIARALGKHRVLHFRDAEAAIAYREEFGYSNTIAGMWAHLSNGARAAANMKVLGPNPEVMFNSVVDDLARRIRGSALDPEDKSKMVRKLLTEAGALRAPIRDALDIATGAAARPDNVTFAKIGADWRIFQSIAKLGGALISSITDPISVAASAQFRGSHFFPSFARQMSGVLQGRGSQEAKEIAFIIGEGFDGHIGHIANALAAIDGPAGVAGHLQELFFRMNGLTWWTDSNRAAAGRMVAAEMALRSHTAFDQLPDAYRHVLGLHGIDEARWSVIQKARLRNVNGTEYVTPDRIDELSDEDMLPLVLDRLKYERERLGVDTLQSAPARRRAQERFDARAREIIDDARHDLKLDVLRFTADETNYGMIEVDARARRTTTWGTRPGTLAGEAIRFVMQFKGWPIAFTQRVIGRQAFARRKGSWSPNNPIFWSETMPHIGTLLAGMTLAGYAAMTAKDALKGYWPPRDPSDWRTWMAAAQQGGAWGIYGDFLFSARNRFGSGLLETMMGPSAGTLGDLWSIWNDARDSVMTGGEDTFPVAKTFSTLWANVPGANLFYVKPVMDYLWITSLRETLSPGYLRRQQRMRQREYGQEPLQPFGPPLDPFNSL